MNSWWKYGIVAAAVLVVAFLGARRAGWLGGEKSAEPPAAERGTARPAVDPGRRGPTVMRGEVALREDDPEGSLRLEGQVIDAEERPVGGATVAIDTSPPRTVTSEGDGSFAIDGLIGRTYRLEAAAAGGHAGPISLRLTDETEPIILRMAPAGRLRVEVLDAAARAPIAGAVVEVRSGVVVSATTGEDGVAELSGVGGSDLVLHVAATGYAELARRLVEAPPATGVARERVLLALGARVGGRVTDAAGAPVAGARVVAVPATEPFPVVDRRRDGVVSDADGRWQIAAVAAGSYRFTARHSDLAPTTTAPLVTDGIHPRDDVDLVLSPGAMLVGSVRDGGRAPVAGADVRLVARGSVTWRFAREGFTDAEGDFRFTGLPARPAEVVASHPVGASPVVPVELTAGRRSEVELTLSVDGTIAGVVVDEAGQELAEAQLFAEPEWTGALGERESWAVRGSMLEVADGGGRFSFTGLPDGKYRVRAAAPNAAEAALWLAPGELLATGTTDARLVVHADGRVRGEVRFPDGSAPSMFTVAVGPTAPEPFAGDGQFELAAPGGTHNLIVSGPSFARAVVAATVTGGDTTDLGTITVEKSRSVGGRVLDAAGAPVPGVLVAAGSLLTGDGTKLFIEDESLGAQTTETDADGRFVMSGFGAGAITVIAGREGIDRTNAVRIPPGPDSVEVDLVLAPTGAIAGTVTRDGKPVPETVVIANPIGATGQNFFVVTGSDGSYALDTLTAGSYQLYPMIGGGGPRPKDMYFRPVEVVAGERARADVAITTGPASLEVSVATEAGEPVAAAQVFVAGLAVDAPNLSMLRDGHWLTRTETDGAEPIPVYMRTAVGGPATIEGMRPGVCTACVVPLPMNPNNPVAARQLQEVMEQLPMKCLQVDVVADPPANRIEVKVPAEWTKPG